MQECARRSSAAQAPDLVPEEAMLQRHRIDCAELPARYGRAARVEKCMDRVLRFESVLRQAAVRASNDPSKLPMERGWSDVFERPVRLRVAGRRRSLLLPSRPLPVSTRKNC